MYSTNTHLATLVARERVARLVQQAERDRLVAAARAGRGRRSRPIQTWTLRVRPRPIPQAGAR